MKLQNSQARQGVYSDKLNLKSLNKGKNLSNANNIKSADTFMSSRVSFGRALTTREANELKGLINKARTQVLKIKNFAMIMFSSMTPSDVAKNPGIGTLNSTYAKNMLKHLNKTMGLDAIQLGPHGIIPGITLSPYSGSSFALSPRSIDLTQLTGEKFGKILSEGSQKLKNLFDGNLFEKENVNLVNKDHVDKYFDDVLKEAFDGFKKLGDNHPLKSEYKNFVAKNGPEWLEKDSLYQAFSKEHGVDYWPIWKNDLDKQIFGQKTGTPEAQARIREISSKHADEINYHKFTQFLVDKQHFETKKELNEAGIRVLGDCPISFAPRDQWANMNDFEPDRFVGCKDTDGSIQYWGGPMWKNGNIVEKRFDHFFGRYDGVRADAGWEYKRAFVYSGDKSQAYEFEQGRDVLDKMNASARRHNVDLSLNSLENANGSCNAGGQLAQLIQEGFPIPEIIITDHGHFADHQPFANWVATTTHDTRSVLEATNGDPRRVSDWFGGLFKGPDNNGKGAQSVLLPFNDVFGMSERINGVKWPDAKYGDLNWKLRVPTKWEEFLNTQLKNGYGFNAPEVIKNAVSWKVPEWQRTPETRDLINRLDVFSKIVREDGPLTTKEADRVIDHIAS